MKRVRCEASGVLVPKDKAVKRFIVRNIVDASAIRDIQDASVIDGVHSSVLISQSVSSHIHIFHADVPFWLLHIISLL